MSVITELLCSAADQLAAKIPRRVTARDLSRHTSDVLNILDNQETLAFVTYHGVPRFMIVPINPDHVSQLILTGSPGLFAKTAAEGEVALKDRKVQAPPEPLC